MQEDVISQIDPEPRYAPYFAKLQGGPYDGQRMVLEHPKFQVIESLTGATLLSSYSESCENIYRTGIYSVTTEMLDDQWQVFEWSGWV